MVPRTKGVSTRHMELSGSTAAGTAFVEFDDVEVSLDMAWVKQLHMVGVWVRGTWATSARIEAEAGGL